MLVGEGVDAGLDGVLSADLAVAAVGFIADEDMRAGVVCGLCIQKLVFGRVCAVGPDGVFEVILIGLGLSEADSEEVFDATRYGGGAGPGAVVEVPAGAQGGDVDRVDVFVDAEAAIGGGVLRHGGQEERLAGGAGVRRIRVRRRRRRGPAARR